MKTSLVCAVLATALSVNVSWAVTQGPPLPSQIFGDSHAVALTAADSGFATDFSTYESFTNNLYAIVGNSNTYLNSDVAWTSDSQPPLGAGVVKFGLASGWPYGFVVYKFTVQPGYKTSGGTISANVRLEATANMEGQYFYLGVSPTFAVTSETLQHFNYGDFTKATCTNSGGWGVYAMTLTLAVPANLTEFYVVFGKEYHSGYYGSVSTDSISVNATVITGSLRGTVVPNDYAGDPSVPVAVKVDVRQGNTSVVMAQKILDAQGQFTIDNITPGTYDVVVKACCWLQTRISGVVIDGLTELDTIHLVSGDVDGTNDVDSTDLSILLGNMDLAGQ